MSLLSLRVYYYYCPSTTQDLARFPRTVAGEYATSLVVVKGTCVAQSKDVSKDGKYLKSLFKLTKYVLKS